MVKLGDGGFDADKVEPIGSFKPIPVGEYLAMITKIELKDSKAREDKPSSKYQQLEFKLISEGPYKNRLVWDILSHSEKAQEFTQRKISGMCRAVGLHHINDTDELKNKPMIISLGIQKGEGGYDDKNTIREYKTADGKSVSSVTTSTPGSAPQKMPWEA
jgi:hypothetical protein